MLSTVIKSTKAIQRKKLPPLPKTVDLLHIYGLRTKKNLSQNFLLNTKLCKNFVRASGITPGMTVVEVGAGPGNITREILLESPKELFVIEKDRRFLPLLDQLGSSVDPGQMKIVLGDVLLHDFDTLLEADSVEWLSEEYPTIKILGNLPFNISTPLLIKWLHRISLKNSFWRFGRVPMVLSFQDEVARRICAKPASYERTRLSAMSQNYCHVDYSFKIKGTSFTPTAMVNTGIVKFTPRKKPFCDLDFKLFEKFVMHLFHHRNHSLEYNFRTLFPITMRNSVSSAFTEAQVNPKLRPYMIGNAEVSRLAKQYGNYCNQVPELKSYNYRSSRRLLTNENEYHPPQLADDNSDE